MPSSTEGFSNDVDAANHGGRREYEVVGVVDAEFEFGAEGCGGPRNGDDVGWRNNEWARTRGTMNKELFEGSKDKKEGCEHGKRQRVKYRFACSLSFHPRSQYRWLLPTKART